MQCITMSFLGPEWQSNVVRTLLSSLPIPSTEVSSAEKSSKGRKHKAVDYRNNGNTHDHEG